MANGAPRPLDATDGGDQGGERQGSGALRVGLAGLRLVGGLCRALTHRRTANNFLCRAFE
jgi:hypothetical protein